MPIYKNELPRHFFFYTPFKVLVYQLHTLITLICKAGSRTHIRRWSNDWVGNTLGQCVKESLLYYYFMAGGGWKISYLVKENVLFITWKSDKALI